MNKEDYKSSERGRLFKAPQGYWSFVPAPLPSRLGYQADVVSLLSLADQAVGNLDGLCYRLPNPQLLSGAYVRREAELSSRIEGTQSTISDLYLFELEPETVPPSSDVREIGNYVTALYYGLSRRPELPLSLRLIREIHGKLMDGVRGRDKTPGEFRTSQNWIGGRTPADARFVPPPVEEMKAALDDLEKFFHRPDPDSIPALLECAMVHYQFETIHPFLDGNGRIGRLLITLLAIERKRLANPLLYLSAYFEQHRDEYFDRLMEVSRTGEWDPWFGFFLKGVKHQAIDATARASRVIELYGKYTSLDLTPTGRRVAEMLFANPYLTVKHASETLGVQHASAGAAVRQLEDLGILQPHPPMRERGQVFVARELLDTFTMKLDSE